MLHSLKPLWDNRQLTIVEAIGSPDPTRSRFDAQDYMESGTPGLKATSDGWLNRALFSELPSSLLCAVSLDTNLPRALCGKSKAVFVNSVGDFQVKDARGCNFCVDQILYGTGKETFDAIRIMQSIQKSPCTPANDAQYPNGRLGQSLQQIAQLVKANVGLQPHG